jgi:hypothetical protein
MPLVYRDKGTSGTQLEVLSGELPIARISKNVLSIVASHAVQWSWDFQLTAAPPGFQHHGHADDFEGAKAGVERNWQLWLTAAGLDHEQYRELAQGVRMIRQALEETFGTGILPNTEQVETPLQECDLIAKAIYALKPTVGSNGEA